MVRAVYCPIWMATGQIPGRVPNRSSLTEAVSPRTKTSGWPGMVQSGSTIARPLRSSGVPRVCISGLPTLPAAQTTVWVGMVQPAACTRPFRMAVTIVCSRTSTPRRRNSYLARSDSSGG